jgi:hypothetical protein
MGQGYNNELETSGSSRYNPNDKKLAEVTNNFTYHKPFGNQSERYETIRKAGLAMAQIILQTTPPSREQSVALTNLEQAVMWANAGIARNEQEVPEVKAAA